jgi:predicted permease
MTDSLRSGLRALRARPGFTAAALATLALGVGANTAVFSITDAVLLRPLPYVRPEELVAIGHVWAGRPKLGSVSPLSFLDYAEQSRSLAETAVYAATAANLSGHGEPEHVVGLKVSERFFSLLGVRAAVGRLFGPEDFRRAGEPVVVLSDALWRKDFASDPGAVGRRLDLGGTPYTVVGVAPADLRFARVDYWRPLIFAPFDLAPPIRRAHEWLSMIGRLKPGTQLAAARADFTRIAAHLRSEHPDIYPAASGWRIEVHPYRQEVAGGLQPALLLLSGLVAFLLLISCINVANLLLAAAEARKKELAVRMALGGTWSALALQLLAEGALLAFTGGALGLLLAAAAVALARRFATAWLPSTSAVAVDGRVALFAVAASVVTLLLFSVAPTAQALRTDVHEMLSGSGRTSSKGRRSARVGHALVVAELGLALPLLVASMVLAGSLRTLLTESPGFSARQLLVFDVALPLTRYPEHSQAAAFFDRLLAGIRALPGVTSAGAVSALPLRGNTFSDAFLVAGRTRLPGEPDLTGDLAAASPGYFAAMRIPLRSGRVFRASDSATQAGVVLIDEEMARRLFPRGDALGRRLNFEGPPDKPQWREVIGVVGHVKQDALDESGGRSKFEYYVPLAQGDAVGGWQMSIAVRTAQAPETLIAPVRSVLGAVDRQQAMHNLSSMEDLVRSSTLDRCAVAILVGIFAVLALLLAAIGLYGVISHAVGMQTRAIGIRFALGARPADVLTQVLVRGVAVSALGILTGFAVLLVISHLLQSLLYGIEATGWQVLTGVSLFLVSVALLATYAPARRAMRVQPVEALREE